VFVDYFNKFLLWQFSKGVNEAYWKVKYVLRSNLRRSAAIQLLAYLIKKHLIFVDWPTSGLVRNVSGAAIMLFRNCLIVRSMVPRRNSCQISELFSIASGICLPEESVHLTAERAKFFVTPNCLCNVFAKL